MKTILTKLRGDKYVWLIVIGLSLFSVLAVYSSTGTLAYRYQAGNTEHYLLKHAFIMALGLGIMVLTSMANYKLYARLSQVLMIISIPLLVYTLFAAPEKNDAARWITLPIIDLSFQTSDLAKLALIMYTARLLSQRQRHVDNFREGFWPVLWPVLLTCGLIMPADFSTASLLFVTCVGLMFVGRVSMKYLLGMAGSSLAVVVLAGFLIMQVEEDRLPGRMGTWKSRVESFSGAAGVEHDQVQLAKIAIARGGMVGQGPGNSMQRDYLPSPYSDYIYAIIIEEYGVVLGAGIILLLYLAFLFRCLRIVYRSVNPFGALLVAGLGLSLVLQAMVNMGVAVDLLPVTGVTLPLVSMGGTSLIFTSMAIGIILSVSRDLGMDARSRYESLQEEGEEQHEH